MKFWRRKKKVRVKVKVQTNEWFLKNGSMFLEELIKDCNGTSNPIRFFSSDQILKATNHIDPKCSDLSDHFNANCSFCVSQFIWYKGIIEGRPYLIKKFTEESELFKDIALSARVSSHSGFLKLIGCCLEFPLPVLVFENTEFVGLNGRGGVGSYDGPLLPWRVRLKIAKEVAIAVTYLHTAFPRIIIHRDIKPENVFLDKNWNAKLTEFLISVTLPEGKSWIKDKLVFVTRGYVDPSYADTGILTGYIDVFSFGIFMLVLLMGRPAFLPESGEVHDRILPYVKNLLEKGEPVEFGGDPNDMRPAQMNKFLELALRCCKEIKEDRPKMILVAKELKLIQGSLDC